MAAREDQRTNGGAGQPVLLYDGDCGFCRSWVPRWRRLTRGRVAFRPYQDPAARPPDVSREALAREIHLVLPDGRVFAGFGALVRSLHAAAPRRWGWLLFAYRRVPGFRPTAEAVYARIARRRHRGPHARACSPDSAA